MKYSFAVPLLIGIAIGAITTGIVTLARDDFFWYRNASTLGNDAIENSIDATFIEGMIPHHEGAIKMANLGLLKAKTDEVKNLSKNIISSQQVEINDMKMWYKEWFGKNAPASSSAFAPTEGGHDMMHMDSMSGDVAKLETSTEFDKDFVRQMIPHHEMAIMMAQITLRTTARSEMRILAQSIIDSQTMEVEQMRSWLTTWK
jgi:uncharacterized protein (DUF305 family)